jgi:membrane protein implicated in regulation of membrane protease activity
VAWLTDNIITLLVISGIALLAIELGVFGFSLFLLFFIGLACLITSLCMAIGILPATLTVAIGSVSVFSLAFAFALWKPLKKMQNSSKGQQVSSDFIGHSFVLERDLPLGARGKHRMSGVEWKVRSEMPLVAGTQVQVVEVEVGELTVAPK